MTKYVEKTAKTEDEAIAQALAELGLTRDEVSVEILERSKSGFLGIGASPAVVRVSYEITESKTGKVEAFLKGLFERMEIAAELKITEAEDGSINVELAGDSIGAVIGRRGEMLDAIQHLTNYAVNHGETGRTRITVDAENYRAKRVESLERLAQKVAAKAVKYRRNVTLEPMNAYERHIIHAALQDYEGVTTYSTGTEPNRRVVVAVERPAGQTDEQPVEYRSREGGRDYRGREGGRDYRSREGGRDYRSREGGRDYRDRRDSRPPRDRSAAPRPAQPAAPADPQAEAENARIREQAREQNSQGETASAREWL